MLGRITPKETQLTLPTAAQKKDGTWVSNYNLLSPDILAAEGWKRVEEIKPSCNESTQYLSFDSAVEADGKIIVTYVAVDMPIDNTAALEALLLAEMGVV